jgi:hypothetical protein
MFAFEENVSGVKQQENDAKANQNNKKGYHERFSTVYSFAVETVTKLRSEGKISQSRDVYPLNAENINKILAHDKKPIKEK